MTIVGFFVWKIHSLVSAGLRSLGCSLQPIISVQPCTIAPRRVHYWPPLTQVGKFKLKFQMCPGSAEPLGRKPVCICDGASTGTVSRRTALAKAELTWGHRRTTRREANLGDHGYTGGFGVSSARPTPPALAVLRCRLRLSILAS